MTDHPELIWVDGHNGLTTWFLVVKGLWQDGGH
jgi:hypothetical protein